jgi:outer membrane protein assembly factor BamE
VSGWVIITALKSFWNPDMQKKMLAAPLLVILTCVLTGCSYMKFPGLYRVAVQQGNIIDQKKVDQLKIGMTKRQAQFVMGSPLFVDTFHEDRWDYLYQLRRGDDLLYNRRFTLIFADDKLVRYEGDYEPKGDLNDMEKYIEGAKETHADI